MVPKNPRKSQLDHDFFLDFERPRMASQKKLQSLDLKRFRKCIYVSLYPSHNQVCIRYKLQSVISRQNVSTWSCLLSLFYFLRKKRKKTSEKSNLTTKKGSGIMRSSRRLSQALISRFNSQESNSTDPVRNRTSSISSNKSQAFAYNGLYIGFLITADLIGETFEFIRVSDIPFFI